MPSRRLMVLACAAMLAGCQIDLFGGDCRAIGDSGYALCTDDSDAIFYLEPNGTSPDGGGALEGTVVSIGWQGDTIAAYRHATFRGDPDGLMVVRHGSISGPVPDETAWLKAHPTIRLIAASEAWKRL